MIDKAEVKQIVGFLNSVREDLCDGTAAILGLRLTELYRVVTRLMDATSATEDQDLKVLLASLELRAREYKQEIEGRLGVRN